MPDGPRSILDGLLNEESAAMPEPLVAIIDDDVSVRRALTRLVQAAGLRAQSFSSAAEFLTHGLPAKPDCLILDVHLGGMSGLELLHLLRDSGERVPAVVITAHDDPQTRQQAQGLAATYHRKPLDAPLLMTEISRALQRETPL